MPPRKRVVLASSIKEPPPWELSDILALNEALEAVETALQGMSTVQTIDVLLQFDEKVVACHHDGKKWWVKFGG